MRKAISAVTAAALSFATFVPTAEAANSHWRNGHGHSAHYGNRGRGHWHHGQWIALGVGAAIVGAAAAAASDRDCYWRDGHRYC